MSLLTLYLVLLKVTLTSFNGPSSLPLMRDELVVKRHVLTDRQLNAAVVAGRCSPGPMGMYVVSAGYFAGGLGGALMGFFALITPAFLIIPMVEYGGRWATGRRARGMMDAVVLACAGLVLVSAEPLARDAITGILLALVAGTSCILLIVKRVETLWLILGAASLNFAAMLLR